ncbi:hypothetical protein HD806DRAFT_295354 [Xylariaceae sp. AK1471]|nr:hypothetical protein HD806DRAFT_295354 [Xylariaceae sp. AK1471]
MYGAQQNRDDGSQSRGIGRGARGPGGIILKGLATGIGLASESYHHRKMKKAREEQKTTTASPATQTRSLSGDINSEEVGRLAHHHEHETDMEMSRQTDESAWRLDEAQDEVAQGEPSSSFLSEHPGNDSRPVDSFLQAHPLSSDSPPGGLYHLEMPVVLTQRRPGTRTRGFVRAYAPILQDVGIDQPTFLEFIDELNKAVEPSPWIQAINLAALAGNAAPEPFTIVISAAVKLATDVASEIHSRTKTNKFLDDMNQSYFAPRNLVALVMTWQPSKRGELMTNVDFNVSVFATKTSTQAKDKWWKNTQNKLKQSSGATSFEFPQTAPLVFPVLDELVTADNQGSNETKKKKSAIKSGGAFVESYLDKRARAKWAGKNPDSNMATTAPKEEFYSRYADPNHPASSGDPIAFLTAGHFQSSGGLAGIRSLGGRSFGESVSRSNLRGLGSPPAGGRGQPIRQDQNHGDSSPAGVGLGGVGPLALVAGVKKLLQDVSIPRIKCIVLNND